VRAVVLGLTARGLSQRAICDELNALGLKSPRGGLWHLPTLQRIMKRCAPEPRVRYLTAKLRRDGHTTQDIVSELAKRGAFMPMETKNMHSKAA
jgi:hypothetical protein